MSFFAPLNEALAAHTKAHDLLLTLLPCVAVRTLAVLQELAPRLLEAADGAIREALPLVACKWFLNVFVDTLALDSLLAVWDLILSPAEQGTSPSSSAATAATAATAAAAAATAPAACTLARPPSDALLRISISLLLMHEGNLLDALDDTGGMPADASVAYAALLAIGGQDPSAVSPTQLIRDAAALPLTAEAVAALRACAQESLAAADAAEVSARGFASWAPNTPVRLRAQQHLLKYEELCRLKVALAKAAGDTASGRASPAGNSGVGREAFGRVLLAETPLIVDAGLRVYDMLRTHSEQVLLPKVPWRELTAALATALRGSLTERLQLVFELFDPTDSGQIDVPHLMAMASMLFKLRLLDPAAAERPIRARGQSRHSVSSRRISLLAASVLTPLPPAAPRAEGGLDARLRLSSRRSSDRTSHSDLSTDALEGAADATSVEMAESEEARRPADDDAHRSNHAAAGSAAASRLPNISDPHHLRPSSDGDGGMSRSTAPVTPGVRKPLLGGIDAHALTSRDLLAAKTSHGRHASRGGGTRRASLDIGQETLPHLKRNATVCGGDRYELVDQQVTPSCPRSHTITLGATPCTHLSLCALTLLPLPWPPSAQVNELLQLLLIADVSRSGSLSYTEWTRGVLSLPEVLSCFQLANLVAASPPRLGDGIGDHRAGGRVMGGVAPPPLAPPVASVSGQLWWRSVWRTMANQIACTACKADRF